MKQCLSFFVSCFDLCVRVRACTVLTTAKFTSFSVMPLNENVNFHKRKRIILTTKPKTQTFITKNETQKTRKRAPKANINDCAHIKKGLCIKQADLY